MGLRPVKFLHTKMGKSFLYGAGFEHGSTFMVKQEAHKQKLSTRSWKQTYLDVVTTPQKILTSYRRGLDGRMSELL